MHVPLDEHLHSEECNVIIRELIKCHEENSKVRQLFGVCNKLDWAMRACTKKERLQHRDENRRSADERQKKIQERLKQMKGKDWRENLKEMFDKDNSS